MFTTAGVPSPCPRRRSRLNTDAKIEPEAFVNQSGKTDQSVAPAKKKGVGAKPKAAHAAQTAKAPQRPPRSSRAASSTEKLVCRYCGSDDLAPSFKKRRYARCRACFKKRYGSAPQDTRRLPALRKRSPRNSSDRAMNRIGVRVRRQPGPRLRAGSAFASRSNQRLDRNQRLRAIRYRAPAPVRSRAGEDRFAV